MAGEWIEASLGELIDIKHGFSFKGEFIHDEPRGDILLTPGNFAIGGGFKADKFKYYDGPVPDEFVLSERDLLVTMTDLSKQSDTLGYPAFVPARTDGRCYLHNQRLGKVVLKDQESLNIRYLHYLMCSQEYRHEVLASATGTTVKHTSPERVKRFRFMCPPLPEQRAIAHILGTLDDKIELNRRMNETLEAIAQALFKSWFVDFDPVRAKCRGEACLAPTMPQFIVALFPDSFVESEMGQIPKGWVLGALYDCAEYINGLAFRNEDFSSDRLGLPVIKIGELKAGITDQTKFTEASFSLKYRVAPGDILFSWSGSPDTSIDTFVWAGGDGWLNQHIFKIQFKCPDQKFFIYFLLRHLKPVFIEIARNKQTTGLGHVTAQDLKRLMTILPLNDVLKAFNGLVGPLFYRIHANQLESRTLASLRDTLLPKLISGELRVKDAERVVGRVV